MNRPRVRFYVDETATPAVLVLALLAGCGGGERPGVEGDTIGIKDDAGAVAPGVDELTIGPLQNGDVFFGDDGLVDCGTQAGSRVLTLTNNTGRIVNFSATLTAGSDRFKINPAEGGVPANGRATIQITPNPIPATSEITKDLYAGTLEIGTKPSVPPKTIRLHQTARGAIITSNAVANTLDFAQVKIGTPAALPFNLTNAGNAPITANLAVGTNVFHLDGATTASVQMAPSGTASKSLVFAPVAPQDYTDTLSLSYTGGAVHCKAPPETIALKGKGTASAGVSPANLNFGQVDCGTAAPFQTVTITSTLPMEFRPNLGKGETIYTLADRNGAPLLLDFPIAMGAADTYTLRVVPKAIVPPASTASNAFADTLTITTNLTGDTPKAVNLFMTARGAIFSFGQAAISHQGSLGQTANNPLTLINSGNAPASYSIAVTTRDGDPSPPSPATLAEVFTSTLTTGTAQVGTTSGTLFTKTPDTAAATVLGALAVTAPGAVMCQDLPAKMPLTATRVAGTNLTTNKTSLNFGLVDCGTAAPFQTIDVTSGVDAATFTPNLGAGGASPFTLADSSGNPLALDAAIPLTKNVPYTMRVVPKAIPIPSPTTANGRGDTLTITSNVDSVKSIPLNQTASGAIFAFNPPSINGANGTYNISLVNSGNASAPYALSGSGGTPTPSSGTAAPGSTLISLVKNGNGSIGVASPGGVLCADLPPPLTLTTPP